MPEKVRIRYWDYIKGLCLIMVLFNHFQIINHFYAPVYNTIAFFHLGAFFVAAGFFFNPEKRTFAENVKTRFKGTMLPFWIACVVYAFFEMFRATWMNYLQLKNIPVDTGLSMVWGSLCLPKIEFLQKIFTPFLIQTEIRINDFQPMLPSMVHLWFLPAMFTASVMFYFLAGKTLKNHWIKVVTVVVLVALGTVESISPLIGQLPWGLTRGFVGAALMLCGFWIKQYKLLEIKNIPVIIISILLCIGITILIVLSNTPASWVIFPKTYYGPALIFIGSICGTWCYLWLFKAFDKLKVEWPKAAIEWVGKYSMEIYLWHILIRDTLAYIYLHIRGIEPVRDPFLYCLLPDDGISVAVNCLGIVLSIVLLGTFEILKHKWSEKRNNHDRSIQEKN